MTAKQMANRVRALSGTRALEGFTGDGENRRTRVQAYSSILIELDEMKPSDRLPKARAAEIEKELGLEKPTPEVEA